MAPSTGITTKRVKATHASADFSGEGSKFTPSLLLPHDFREPTGA